MGHFGLELDVFVEPTTGRQPGPGLMPLIFLAYATSKAVRWVSLKSGQSDLQNAATPTGEAGEMVRISDTRLEAGRLGRKSTIIALSLNFVVRILISAQ